MDRLDKPIIMDNYWWSHKLFGEGPTQVRNMLNKIQRTAVFQGSHDQKFSMFNMFLSDLQIWWVTHLKWDDDGTEKGGIK